MKKIILLLIFSFSVSLALSQPLTSLHENFNTRCIASGPVPHLSLTDWLTYCQYTGGWLCNKNEGRYGTPGVECSNSNGAGNTLDTAYLITPELDISGYPGNVYLLFDAKTTYVHSGAKLSLVEATDSPIVALPDTSQLSAYADIGALLTPTFGPADSAGWVTHQVDITSFKVSPFFIAFRYTGNVNLGSIWFIDNVNITDTPLIVPTISSVTLPLTLTGNNTREQIQVSCYIHQPGTYYISVCDILGRELYKNAVEAPYGKSVFTIDGLHMPGGMYFIKVGNGSVYGTIKTVVP